MPLKKGKENVGWNIDELTHHGSKPRSHAQIVAISLRAAGVPRKVGTLREMAGATRNKRT